eukprot:GFKZ01004831.1.p1 GENE.GFKZ01004831.1~~GFKZ01004831.1.p1  ORF type:complete len:429 (-),score=81.95 GFKZ01004831.1:301-1587(-)
METTKPPAAPPISPPPPPKPSLPRSGTFRTARPTSFTDARRRNATFINRPQSFSGATAGGNAEAESEQSKPRLRRGSSFTRARPNDGAPQGRLRRGSSFVGRRSGGEGSGGDAAGDAAGEDVVSTLRRSSRTSRLPRAGTFAFGSERMNADSEGKGGLEEVGRDAVEMQGVSSVDLEQKGRSICGMCSGCGVGLKGMPPWAPERLKLMTEEERADVWREFNQKEERGRLERELRVKRLKDTEEMERRMEKRRDKGNAEEKERMQREEETQSSAVTAMGPGGDLGDISESQSVDLRKGRLRRSDTIGSRGSRVSRRRRSNASGGDISGEAENHKGKGALDSECGQCNDLEGKVRDLEEQLGVLEEVVTMCGEGDADEKEKKPKTWKDKVMSAYYGSSGGTEKQRLKQEVEALRKATDFLFQKLQESDTK